MNNVNFLFYLNVAPVFGNGDTPSVAMETFIKGRDTYERITVTAWGKTAEVMKGWSDPGISVMGTGSIYQKGQEDGYSFGIKASRLSLVNANITTPEGAQGIYDFNFSIVGNLGQDPDVKRFDSGSIKASGSIALRAGKDKVNWIKWETWGKTAEIVEKYCHKGSRVGFNGALKVDRWKDSPVLIASADNLELLGNANSQQ